MAGQGDLRRQWPGRPGRSPSGRPRLVRQEFTPAGAGAGFVVGAGLGGHRRAPSAHRPRGASTAWPGLRQLLPLSHRVPHRGPGRPRGSRRPSVPGLAGAGSRVLPRPVSPGTGGPDLRLRRVPAGLSDQPCRRPAGSTASPRRGQPALGGPPRAPRALRRSPDGGARPLVHRRTRSPVPTPECTPGAGQRGGRLRPRNRAGIDPLAVGRRRDDRRARTVGGPGAGTARPGGCGTATSTTTATSRPPRPERAERAEPPA